MTIPKPQLEKGKEYTVRLYPTKETVQAKYLGTRSMDKWGTFHVFDSSEKAVLLFDDWIFEEDGIITHHLASSFSVYVYNKKNIEKGSREEEQWKNSGLLKILNYMGGKLLKWQKK